MIPHQRICACQEVSIEERKTLFREVSHARTNIKDDDSVITIKVIFHISFHTNYLEHVIAETDWIISELNKDFAKQASNFNDKGPFIGDKKNTYLKYVKKAHDTKIVFEKESVHYSPVPPQNSSNTSVLDQAIKSKSPPISPQTKLNIWAADLTSGILGYAQFPWSLKSHSNTDGVVISKGCYGRCAYNTGYDRNKTLTHEVGHWLGLYHTFQDTHPYAGGQIDYMDGTAAQEIQEAKGDLVVDTPPQGTPTYGNPLRNPNVWPESSPADVTGTFRHMFMNFMDYSDDVAMFMFTKDQSIKMRLMVHMYRPSLVPGFTVEEPELVDVEPETVPEPEPEPEVAPPLYENNFEPADQKWNLYPRFGRNNAQIRPAIGIDGSRGLRMRRRSRAVTSINLTGAIKPQLTLMAKNTGRNSRLYVRSTGSRRWKSYKINANTPNYKEVKFNLPGRFGANYRIAIYADPKTSFSYFDKVDITEL